MTKEVQFKFCIRLVIFLKNSLFPSSFLPFNWLFVGGLLFWNVYFLPLLFFCLGPWGEWKLAKCDGCSGGRLGLWPRELIPPRVAKSISFTIALLRAKSVSFFFPPQYSKPGQLPSVLRNPWPHPNKSLKSIQISINGTELWRGVSEWRYIKKNKTKPLLTMNV